jgi:hypothetical protein
MLRCLKRMQLLPLAIILRAAIEIVPRPGRCDLMNTPQFD